MKAMFAIENLTPPLHSDEVDPLRFLDSMSESMAKVKPTEEAVCQWILSTLRKRSIESWLGPIDYAAACLHVGEDYAWSERRRIRYTDRPERVEWGVINRAVEWATFCVDRQELQRMSMETLQASIIAVLAYTLCDHAREAGRQDVCHELQQYFEDSDFRLFIDRLEATPCDAEEALGVWTISWEIEADFGSDEQAELRHAIEEYLDEALDELDFGYVDGGQAGSGTMEVFCVSLNASLDESWFVHTCEKAGFPRPYSIAFER